MIGSGNVSRTRQYSCTRDGVRDIGIVEVPTRHTTPSYLFPRHSSHYLCDHPIPSSHILFTSSHFCIPMALLSQYMLLRYNCGQQNCLLKCGLVFESANNRYNIFSPEDFQPGTGFTQFCIKLTVYLNVY